MATPTSRPQNKAARIALVGDFNAEVLAHSAIEQCFALANKSGLLPVKPEWIPTESLVPRDARAFDRFNGLWCVPASPYRSTEGALWAIRCARTRAIPFLGTCGGFQHALLEYAHNALGLKQAEHAETNPEALLPLVSRMRCPLIEQTGRISVVAGSDFRNLYGAGTGSEGFHCSFGLNPAFEHLFEGTPLEIVARSEEDEVRAIRLRGHPFFIGVLFQPERRALTGSLHPLVQAFFSAGVAHAASV